jgi:hypothetical protein
MDCLDQRLPVAIVTDRSPGGVDPAAQCRFRYDPAAPDGVEKLTLADHAIAVAHKMDQYVVHLRFQVHDLTGPAQFLPAKIDLMTGEDDVHMRLPFAH